MWSGRSSRNFLGMIGLKVVLAVGVLTGGCSSQVSELIGTADGCADPASLVTPIFQFDQDLHGLVNGEAAVISPSADAQRIVVAGMEIDMDAEISHPARLPRIIVEGEGAIAPPGTGLTGAKIEMPVPVMLGEARWGLLWAEPEIGLQYVESPMPFALRRLMFAERLGSEWSQPVVLADAPLGMHWEVGRTIRYSHGGVPYVMTIVDDQHLNPRIVFGSPDSGLLEIQLPPGLAPHYATFAVDEHGLLTVVAYVAAQDRRYFVSLTSSDQGRSWSTPDQISVRSNRVVDVEAFVDAESNFHLLWMPSLDEIRHAVRRAGSGEWEEQSMELPEGVLLRWQAGVDRCGRFRLVLETMRSSMDIALEEAVWSDLTGWTATEAAFTGYEAVNLFGSASSGGEWIVGWTGVLAHDINRERPDLRVWVAIP